MHRPAHPNPLHIANLTDGYVRAVHGCPDLYVSVEALAMFKSCWNMEHRVSENGKDRSFTRAIQCLVAPCGYNLASDLERYETGTRTRFVKTNKDASALCLVMADTDPLCFSFILYGYDASRSIRNPRAMYNGGLIFHAEYQSGDSKYAPGLRGHWSTHT